jgi:hypothetical protein
MNEIFKEGMFESSGIMSRHELCFQQSSKYWSVPTLERITVDSISHGVLGIEKFKAPAGKLDSIITSTIQMHKVMIVANRKTEWVSKFMDWGESLYHNEGCDHLRRAFIDPAHDFPCTGEEESFYSLVDSQLADTTMDRGDHTND